MAEKSEDYCDKMLREMQAYQKHKEEEVKRKAEETERIQKILSEAEQTNDRFDKFKASLSAAVDESVEQTYAQLCGGLTPGLIASLTHTPVEVQSGTEAAHYLKDCNNLLILTGAGLSAASGVPTFRGSGGFWSRSYAGVEDPQEVLTQRFFQQQPQAFWDWHFDFEELMHNKEPNQGHFAI